MMMGYCGRINWMVMIMVWVILMPQVKMENEVKNIYSCWGGCYNNCFLVNKGKDDVDDSAKTFQCYFTCLNNCTASASSTPPDPYLDFENFCKGGCYLNICIPLSFVGANIGDCLGSCANLCKFFSKFTKMQLMKD